MSTAHIGKSYSARHTSLSSTGSGLWKDYNYTPSDPELTNSDVSSLYTELYNYLREPRIPCTLGEYLRLLALQPVFSSGTSGYRSTCLHRRQASLASNVSAPPKKVNRRRNQNHHPYIGSLTCSERTLKNCCFCLTTFVSLATITERWQPY